MNDIIKTDILNVINNSLIFIENNDYVSLKDLSNHVIHNASIFQDKYSINIAVIIYSISKIFKKAKEIDPKLKNLIIRLKENLEKNNLKQYETLVKDIYKTIAKNNTKFRFYVEEVIELAQVKKGSKIYDHGISLSQSANILGISQWELMDYIGKTKMEDNFQNKEDIKAKLEFTRALFKVQ